MKPLIVVLALLVATSAIAQGELTISATADRTTARTGERFAATILIRNTSSVTASEGRLNFGFTRGTIVFDLTAPAGWQCNPAPTDHVTCLGGTIAAGADATFRATLLTPNHLEDNARAVATISWRAAARPVETRSAVLPLTVTASPRRADLGADRSMSMAREGETVDITFDVRNHGPDSAGRVWLMLFPTTPTIPVRGISGGGWTCEGALCTRASLAAGEHAPLTVRVETPREAIGITVIGYIAGEDVFDSELGNNYPSHQLWVANAERYEKVLLPLTPGVTAGANGSIWMTQISMLIDSDTPVELFPTPCVIGLCPPPNPPLRTPFRPEDHRLIDSERSDPRGWLFYTSRGDAAKLRFNIRTQDTSRTTQTWGTEMPVVREHDVTTGRVVLMDVPTTGAFRHELRIYDFDGIGGEVRVDVHAMGSAAPIATFTRSLVGSESRTTQALLPLRPAYGALSSTELRGIAAERIWYSITPVTPGLRIWAYVTITNNETQRVTIVSPQ